MVIKGNNGRSIPRSYGLCLFILALVMIAISLLTKPKEKGAGTAEIEKGMFATSTIFNIGSVIISGILFVLYWFFWNT